MNDPFHLEMSSDYLPDLLIVTVPQYTVNTQWQNACMFLERIRCITGCETRYELDNQTTVHCEYFLVREPDIINFKH